MRPFRTKQHTQHRSAPCPSPAGSPTRSRRTAGLLLALAAIVSMATLATGCEGAKVSGTADRTTIAAGGCDEALVTATVTISGKPKGSKTVTFDTTAGSFSKTEDLTSTTAVTDAEGKATVELFATTAVGTATVTATFQDANYDASQSITITFGPPTGEFAPVSDKISLTCDQLNVGALRNGQPEAVVPCHLSAETAAGCPLPAAAFIGSDTLILKAEAGTLEAKADDWTGNLLLAYKTSGGSTEPVDVDPAKGEPSRAGPLGETLNPRDGVVTIFVALRGREAFTDVNGNGVFDEDEPFDDTEEPFLDADDDGVFTLGIDPYFADSNGNGKQDGPNGTYDATTYIAASFKIIWSGDLEEKPDAGRLELSGPAAIPNGGSVTITAYLLDARLNPIAAFSDNYDYVGFTLNNGWTVMDPSSGQRTLKNVSAIHFDNQGRYLEYLPEAAAYTVTLSDDDSSTTNDPPYDWSLSVDVTATAGTDADGNYLSQDSYTFQQPETGTYQ
ncbi:MAG: hypothetical protein J7M25_13890 [Deltaproteobacteria bacterium]|nr:hypothetical protein [Deltaproteobacteria bacterium]